MPPKKHRLKDVNGEIIVEVSPGWIRMWREHEGKVAAIIGFEPHILNQIKARYKKRTPKVRA